MWLRMYRTSVGQRQFILHGLRRLYGHFHVNPDNDICVTVIRFFYDSFWVMVLSSEKVLWEAYSWKQQLHSKFPKSSQSSCFRHPLDPFGTVQGHLRCVGEATRMATWTTLESNSFASHCCLFWCRRELQQTCGCCPLALIFWIFYVFFLTNMFFCMNMLSGYIRYPMYTMHSSTSHHITWFICIELSSCTLFFVHVLVLGAYLPSIFNCFEVYCISLSNCAPLLRSWCQSDPSEPRWREPICIWSSRTLHFSHGF